MALDLRQNFVSVQYLEKNGQILTKLYITFYKTRSALGLLAVIFRTFVPELWS